MPLHEPAVALTDFALALENALFAVLLWRTAHAEPGRAAASGFSLRRWSALFFAFVSLSSLLGGLYHGFIVDESRFAARLLWRATLLTIGLIAVSGANAAAQLAWSERTRAVVARLSAAAFCAYFVIVLAVSQDFRNAILIYLPATLYLLISFIVAYLRLRTPAMIAGAFGMVLTFVAAGVQQSSFALPSIKLDHNALYHLIQGIALALVFAAMRAAIHAHIPAQNRVQANTAD